MRFSRFSFPACLLAVSLGILRSPGDPVLPVSISPNFVRKVGTSQIGPTDCDLNSVFSFEFGYCGQQVSTK